jgi:uncharacterized repeat protein (TIGR02543 family)
MKKRITAALLCVVLCFAMLGTAYAVEATPKISVSGTSGQTYVTVTASGLNANTTYAMCSIVQGDTLMALFNMTTNDAGGYTGTITTGPLTSGKTLTVSIPEQATGVANSDVATGNSTVAAATTPGGGDSGGGGGGGGSASTITLTFDTNGGSAISKVFKSSGTTIDLSAYKPTKTGYTFDGWYTDAKLTDKVTSIKLTKNMTVYAKWAEDTTGSDLPFTDVASNAYYFDAVKWAVENGITSGTTATTFAPNATCTRAQTVTFLWRAMGSPEPTTTVNPFTDVKTDAYYYKAVLWAVEKGITVGTSATTFAPNTTVTRAQVATFLWRAAGTPAATTASTFTDVPSDAYYAAAVLWAAEKGITSGTSATTFSPASDCTRAQIVTFLYRYLSE